MLDETNVNESPDLEDEAPAVDEGDENNPDLLDDEDEDEDEDEDDELE